METNRPDVIQILEQEKEFYLERIKRINFALSALRGELKTESIEMETTPTRKIEWTAEVVKLFDEYEELDVNEIREKLAEKGIPEALEDKHKNTVNTTLNRKIKDNTLVKTETGGYRKKLEKAENVQEGKKHDGFNFLGPQK